MLGRIGVLTCLLALSCLGCKAPSIYGTWDTILYTFPARVTFQRDGKMTANATMPRGTASISGTYAFDGKKLTFKGKSVELTAKDPDTQVIMNLGLPRVQAEIERERSGSMEWKNENQFVFTSNDVKLPVTFTRVQDEER